MKRSIQRLGWRCAVAAGLLSGTVPALAANPTKAECIAANNSAIDLRNDQKLRAAGAQLLVCASESCRADIRKECARQSDEVRAALPTIAFDVKDGSGNSLSEVKVTMDGEVLVDRLDGTAVPVDPGNHAFSFEAQGQTTVHETLLIVEAQKDRHEVVRFAPSAPPPCPQGLQRPSPSMECATPPPPVCSTDSQWSDASKRCEPLAKGGGLGTQQVLAIAAGGVGVVGLGIGTAFGVIAISKKNDAENACPQTVCLTADGPGKWHDAKSAATVSTIGFIVGGVGIAGAAALWFTAPKEGAALITQVGLGLGGIQVRGTW